MGLNHVEPGGRAAGRTTVRLDHHDQGQCWTGRQQCLFAAAPAAVAACLIDAANDDDRLLKIISDQPLDTIVTTHRHADHWQALPSVAAATGARLVCGQPDLEAISTGAGSRA